MKAAVLTGYRKFEVKELSIPEIKAVEVLVRIEFASICGSDMHVFNGDFHPRTPVPFIPGHEMAGIVELIGNEVKGYLVGDKVAIDPIICLSMRATQNPSRAGLKDCKNCASSSATFVSK